MTNMKFHIMAVSMMITAAIIVFLVAGNKEQIAAEAGISGVDPNKVIDIHSATWGENCNYVLDLKRKDYARRNLPTDGLDNMERNNVLHKMKELCGGKFTCQIKATPKVLENKKHPSCRKRLDVEYRCFAYDRLWQVKAAMGENLVIDCTGQGASG
ncbi:MAG: SUEL-type lectin domain-containing protein [Rickettsiales bacterium]|nr:SUEL-type lectin domain-containing protein [Rickettsiales bacterium]